MTEIETEISIEINSDIVPPQTPMTTKRGREREIERKRTATETPSDRGTETIIPSGTIDAESIHPNIGKMLSSVQQYAVSISAYSILKTICYKNDFPSIATLFSFQDHQKTI